jgi:hypothetical protein
MEGQNLNSSATSRRQKWGPAPTEAELMAGQVNVPPPTAIAAAIAASLTAKLTASQPAAATLTMKPTESLSAEYEINDSMVRFGYIHSVNYYVLDRVVVVC